MPSLFTILYVHVAGAAQFAAKMWTMKSLLAALALTLASMSAFAQADRAHDGDTIKIDGQNVRMAGIDAPELRQMCDDGKWPAGYLATQALLDMISGDKVTCEYVGKAKQYGQTPPRPLGRCYANGIDLSRAMVAKGWAWAYVQFPTPFRGEEATARAAGLGVHAHDCHRAWEWRAERR